MKKAVFWLLIFLLVFLVSCETGSDDYYQKNPTIAPEYTYDPDWTPMPAPTDASGNQVTGNPYDYINPERLFDIGEWFDICGMQFRLNSVEFTKQIGEMDPEEMFTFGVSRIGNGKMVDAEGNLYGNRSYVIIHVDVKNATDQEVEFGVGNLGLKEHIKDEKGALTEINYIAPAMYENKHSNYYLLQPEEEVAFTLYSTIEDCLIDNEPLYFYVPSFIIPTVPKDETGTAYQYDAYVPINKNKSELDIYADYKDEHDFINPNRIYNIDETAEMKGMSFRVNSVTIGKKLEGISMDRIRYDDHAIEIVGSDGTFREDAFSRVYITSDITIKNLTDQEIELCLGAIYLSSPTTGGGISFEGASGVTPSITKDLTYDDFYRFQPGEEVTFHVYHIGADTQLGSILEDDTIMIHFPLNMGLQDKENPELPYDYDIFVPIKKDKSQVNIYRE